MPIGNLQELLISIPAILIAITFHEYAHGMVAYRLGDPTAANQGRLTLNPRAHLDPLGALLFIFAGFGWAKPVPVNPYYFQGDRHKAMMIVSLAGPFINVVLAYLAAVFMGMIQRETLPDIPWFSGLLYKIYWYNLVLAVFNLIPVPPLDGSKILAGILPRGSANFIYSIEQYGPLILMLLIITRTTWVIIYPVIQIFEKIIFIATGISS